METSHGGDGGDLVLFETADGEVRLDVRLGAESVWLTQAQMAALFDRDRSVVTRHLRNVFESGELAEERSVRFLHIAGSDKPVGLYNLDAILSVGYRVNSKRGTQFRIWATRTLRDHLLRGYTLHARRLGETGLKDVEDAVALLARTLKNRALVTDEGPEVTGALRRRRHAPELRLRTSAGGRSSSRSRAIGRARTARLGVRPRRPRATRRSGGPRRSSKRRRRRSSRSGGS